MKMGGRGAKKVNLENWENLEKGGGPGLCKSHKNSYSSSRNKPLTGLVNSAKKGTKSGSKSPVMKLKKNKA
jgi:hypothetical protein